MRDVQVGPKCVTGEQVSRRWRYYTTANGGKVVEKELAGLGPAAEAAIKETMKRARSGELLPREDKQLSGTKGLRELRISLDGNEYRLIYSSHGQTQVLLALHALRKKSQRLPTKAVRLAERRRRDWLRREP